MLPDIKKTHKKAENKLNLFSNTKGSHNMLPEHSIFGHNRSDRRLIGITYILF